MGTETQLVKVEHLYKEFDENTKVLYLCVYGYSTMGITPIYNSDGTLKLYDGE